VVQDSGHFALRCNYSVVVTGWGMGRYLSCWSLALFVAATVWRWQELSVVVVLCLFSTKAKLFTNGIKRVLAYEWDGMSLCERIPRVYFSATGS
jgi:hypothetical protein